MQVKQYYCSVSEQVLYEVALNPKDRRRSYYPYWMSVKNLDIRELKVEDHMRIDKILQFHKQIHKRK